MKYSADYLLRLSERMRQPLPGIEIQMQMAPGIRAKTYQIPDNARRGAILALIYPHQDELHTVLMKRTEDGHTHSGQVSFPGGSVEKNDTSYTHTALREAEEELGIPADKVEVLGAMSELYIPPSNFMVYPTLGFMAERPNFVTQASEVAYVIEVPLRYLLQEEIKMVQKVPMSGNHKLIMDAPCYLIDNHIVWGATAMMIAEFNQLIKDVVL
ncbi:MAG: NUDIX hydrolase [Bacteroidia bacterium]